VPVDAVLRAQRYAVGGTMAAAWSAASGERSIAMNLGGGFHHAEPEQGSGFCVYNDVAVAIARLRARGFEERVAIVDLDYHQGSGNVVAFAHDESVLTFSIHGAIWTRVEAVADCGHLLPPGTKDHAYLELLTTELRSELEAFEPSLVFYVAGNDVLAGDRLGDFALTPAGVFARDRFVTELCIDLGAALVITLAGGYSQRAWRSTFAYLMWLLTEEAYAFEGTEGDVGERYERIARTLDPAELQRDDGELSITMDDVLGELAGPPRQRRVLGFYSAYGVELALERYGFFELVRARGFEDLELAIDPSDPDHQVLRLRGRRNDMTHPVLLIELVVSLREHRLPKEADPAPPLRLLVIEWLLLQDPTRPFSLSRPPLPAQEHPGLGCSREVLELIAQAAKRLGADGVLNRPAHYHVARLAMDRMSFLDPVYEGRLAAMNHVLAAWEDLAAASAAVTDRKLVLGDGQPLAWEPADLVLPTSEKLESWLSSERYRTLRDRERDRLLDAGLRVAQRHAPREPRMT
jgi:hypothetical protein